VKHFLADEHARSQTQKRGGGISHQSLDAPSTTSLPGIQIADDSILPPDAAFDHHWALAVLDRALARVEGDCRNDEKLKQFQMLQPWLAGGSDQPQSEAAFQLGLSEAATRVAIHRLRQKFRDAVRAELAQTVGPGISIDEELQHLFSALSNAR
jgi:RNA polymerase sigma-70 factor (ECF subfamily)